MNKKELTELLDKIIFHYRQIESSFDTVYKIGFLYYDSPFVNSIWQSFEGMLDIIEKQLDTSWISWYIFDNQCGEKELRGQTGSMKKLKTIKTTKDLAQLILEDIKDKEFGKYPFK